MKDNKFNSKIVGATTLTALLAGGSLAMLPAHAETINDAIHDVKVSTTAGDGSFYDQSNIVLSAQWSVPDGSKPGDTFTMELPSYLDGNFDSFPLKDAQGNTVANATVQNHVVTVTLSDYVETHSTNISGSLNFSQRLNLKNTSVQNVSFTLGGSNVSFDVKPSSVVGKKSVVEKRGYAVDQNTQGYVIDLPGKLTNAVVKDTPVDSQIKCDSVTVTYGSLNADGTLNGSKIPKVTKTVKGSVAGIDCSPTNLSWTVDSVNSGDIVRIDYQTTLNDSSQATTTNNYQVTSEEVNVAKSVKTATLSASGDGTGTTNPTATPTPTDSSTSEPSVEPTVEPTDSATPSPTESTEPTVEPTVEPTDSATPTPTDSPTSEPSVEPTDSATPSPTESSTTTPEPSESTEPTVEPTVEPTDSATPTPTDSPTSEPTDSATPSSMPTVNPNDNLNIPQASQSTNTTVETTPGNITVENGDTVERDYAGNLIIKDKNGNVKATVSSKDANQFLKTHGNPQVVEQGTMNTGGEMQVEENHSLRNALLIASGVVLFGVVGTALVLSRRKNKNTK